MFARASSVCLSVSAKLKNYWSKIDATLSECVLRWILEVMRLWCYITFIINLESYFRIFFDKNITCNLKTNSDSDAVLYGNLT